MARTRSDRSDRQSLAARRAEEQARLERSRAIARGRRLDELADDEEAAWTRVQEMIATRKPTEYDSAIRLLADLRASPNATTARTSSPDFARPSFGRPPAATRPDWLDT